MDRPIRMSAPKVRALLAGTKTQTRRIVKLPHQNPLGQWEPITMGGPNGGRTRDGNTIPLQGCIWHTRTGDSLLCPYGQPGDRLWVREAWRYRCSESTQQAGQYRHTIAYRADDARQTFGPMPMDGVGLPKWRERDEGMSWEAWDERMNAYWRQWRPSNHMPRWASRILLEVTEIRVERLQDISEADAWAEGCTRGDPDDVGGFFPAEEPDPSGIGARGWDNACDWYADLWESINGKTGPASWDANPWVWAVSFRRTT